MSNDKDVKPVLPNTSDANQALYPAMAMAPDADPAMVVARAVTILNAAIRRVPEQSWPHSSQQFTTHKYV
jgi:hypothetical protein